MKPLSNKNLARGFNQFIFEHQDQFLSIFEASFLNKLVVPGNLVSKIHMMEEPIEPVEEPKFLDTSTKKKNIKYPKYGHMYSRGTPMPMEYVYEQPPAVMDVPEPTVLTGQYLHNNEAEEVFRTPEDGPGLIFPQQANNASKYKDIAWYLIKFNSGEETRVLLTDKNKSAFFYIYYKSVSAKNIPGDQFAMAVAFKHEEEWQMIDIGYGESVTLGAALKLIGKRHESKGGNRTDKVMEMIKNLTGAPSRTNPIYAYNITDTATSGMDPSAIAQGLISKEGLSPKAAYKRAEAMIPPREARRMRAKRRGLVGVVSSIPFIDEFSMRVQYYLNGKEELAQTLYEVFEATTINYPRRTSNVPEGVISLKNYLEENMEVSIDPVRLFMFLFAQFRDYRAALFSDIKDLPNMIKKAEEELVRAIKIKEEKEEENIASEIDDIRIAEARNKLIELNKRMKRTNYSKTPGKILRNDNDYMHPAKSSRKGVGVGADPKDYPDVLYQYRSEMKDADQLKGARRGDLFAVSNPEFKVEEPQALVPYAHIPSILTSEAKSSYHMKDFLLFIISGEILNYDPTARIARMMGMEREEYEDMDDV